MRKTTILAAGAALMLASAASAQQQPAPAAPSQPTPGAPEAQSGVPEIQSVSVVDNTELP
jgi:hypothetical protein